MTDLTLEFGCNRAIPEGVSCVWGARLIWPDDLVWDRQSCAGGSDDERAELLAWLNDGAGREFRARARHLAQQHELDPTSEGVVTLYEDERGIVKASPQSSGGYLYVAAWLKPLD